LSALHTYVPQEPQLVPGATVIVPQPMQTFRPGSAHVTLDLSALHSYFPHCPQAELGAAASVPHPPHALTGHASTPASAGIPEPPAPPLPPDALVIPPMPPGPIVLSPAAPPPPVP
jgi:hypothetical protein